MLENNINIFFAINNGYSQQLCVTLASIIYNNENENLNFYVMHSSITEDNQKILADFIKQHKNTKIQFVQIDDNRFSDFQLNLSHISKEIYYRFLIPQLFPKLDKALYLDCDLVVNGTLKELWDTDIKNYYCAGVKELYLYKQNYPSEIDLTEKDVYINAGVLLINIKKMNEDRIVEKLFKNTKKFQKKVLYQDQDIINITCKGKIKQLDSIYNFTKEHQFDEVKKISTAKIVHYNGFDKPWGLQECRSPLASLYFKYLERTPYSPKVKIFSFYHKPYYLYLTDCIEPMQNGASTADNLLPILHDDTGDNISEKNQHYAELTGNYWVWKNFLPQNKDVEYIGFCHYRRFLDFDKKASSNRCFVNFIDCIDFAKKYNSCYSSQYIYDRIKEFDVILPELHHLTSTEGSIYQQFITNHPQEEIDKVINIIKSKYPEMVLDMDEYLKGNTGYFCLNYVMKRKLFDNFMNWMFTILKELDKKANWKQYKDYLNEKTPAYLMERFFNVWLRYQIRVNGIKISEQEGLILSDNKNLYTEEKTTTKKIFPGFKIIKSKNKLSLQILGITFEKNKLPDFTSFSWNLSFKVKNILKKRKKKKKEYEKIKIFPGITLKKYKDERILKIFFLKIKFFVSKTPETVSYYWWKFSYTRYRKGTKKYQEKFIKNKKINLVATLLVRDEVDIIEENIKFHLRQGVDFIIATDNGSIDGTRDVLLKYQKIGCLHLIDEPSHDYNQVAWVHRMIKLAKKKYKADWIINLDADEFWFSQRGNLKEDLKFLDEYNVIYVPSLFMYPEENKPKNEPFYYNVKGQYKQLMKCIHRTNGYKKIHMGSHDVNMNKKISTSYTGISLFHYFMRSYEQFENKTRISGKALSKNTSLTNQQGWMMLELYKKYLSGKLRSEYKKRLLTPYNSFIYDTRLKDYYLNGQETPFEKFKKMQLNVIE